MSGKQSNWFTVVNSKLEGIHPCVQGLLFCFSIPEERSGNTDEKLGRWQRGIYFSQEFHEVSSSSPLQKRLLFSSCFSKTSYKWKIVEIYNMSNVCTLLFIHGRNQAHWTLIYLTGSLNVLLSRWLLCQGTQAGE